MSCRSSTTADAHAYADRVRETFAQLKRARDGGDDVIATACGSLVPVGERHSTDEALISSLSRWREAAAHAFPMDLTVTHEGTARWLRMGLLDAPDRMLWLVRDRDGRPVGHAGFANALNRRRELELDNVVRGEPGAPGAMGAAVAALTDWARAVLEPASISLRVLSDNAHALRFYRLLGWEARGREPTDDGAPPSREFVRMALPLR